MASIAIVTDTDSSLPEALARVHDIRQVPINVHFGQDTFESGIDIDDIALFARVDREGRLPSTSAPTPGQFAAAFDAAFQAGAETVLCFCVSGEISATCKSATTARELTPERDIVVVDTRVVTMAQGFAAIAAAEAAAAGASKEEALARAQSYAERSFLFAGLSTVKYLAMSGRVGHLAAGLASLLDVKPVLTIQDGKLQMLERVRSRTRSLARLIELTGARLGGRKIERLAIIHVAAEKEARAFEPRLRSALSYSGEIVFAEVSPGLSVHTGAGMVGVTGIVTE